MSTGTTNKSRYHGSRIRRISLNAAVVGCAFLISLGSAEALLHFALVPSVHSSGRVFGLELAPMRVLPSDYGTGAIDGTSRGDEPYQLPRAGATPVTNGDMFGIMREDPLLAYAPKESAASAHGWWRANNFGARHDHDISAARTFNRQRVLYFGDSYTQGSRVPQEAAYVSVLGQLLPGIDSINFGVDGYSTGQTYLRYRQLSQALAFDAVVLVIVPTVDLWRDISVSRYIAERWKAYKLQPRFYLSEGRLKLARSPFPSLASQLADGPDFPIVRRHLLAHDAFYFSEYEPWPAVDWLVTARLVRTAIAGARKRAIYVNLRSPESEAMQITLAIVAEFQRNVTSRGATFALAVLPSHSDLSAYGNDASFRESWNTMQQALCGVAVRCIDVMTPMATRPIAEFDVGYDGTHYGPKANRTIAEILAASIGPLSR